MLDWPICSVSRKTKFAEWKSSTKIRGRGQTSLFIVVVVMIYLFALITGAAGQPTASSTLQNPLDVVDFIADSSTNGGQQVFVRGQPYCYSTDDCELFDLNVFDKFIDFDPTLLSSDDRDKFTRCPIPAGGSVTCSVILGGTASNDPSSLTNLFASTIQWITPTSAPSSTSGSASSPSNQNAPVQPAPAASSSSGNQGTATQMRSSTTGSDPVPPFQPFDVVHGLTIPSDDLSFSDHTCAEFNQNESDDQVSLLQNGWIVGYIYARLQGQMKNGRPLADYVDTDAILMFIKMYCGNYPEASESDAGDAAAANARASK